MVNRDFNDGLDLDEFWRDDTAARANNCFNDGTKVALGIRMPVECIYDELGIRVNHPWEKQDPQDMHKWIVEYNDKAERMVGMRMLNEEPQNADAAFPEVKRIGEVFGGRYIWYDNSEWLDKGPMNYGELEAVLDRVETMDYGSFMLPAGWEADKKRIYEKYGVRPQPFRAIRGPVTLACSVLGSEELIYLINDEPELARRFSNAITHAILNMAKVMDDESGATLGSVPGFTFLDDNCCLLNPEMYEFFGYPILRDVFEHFSPLPEHSRYQHSDSDMGHLLPILGKLKLSGVNFGPNVLTPEIRRYLPKARVDGCIAPFSFSRNNLAELETQVVRDCKDGLEYGGVNISTAGSINYGSSLSSLRFIMSLIQRHGRK